MGVETEGGVLAHSPASILSSVETHSHNGECKPPPLVKKSRSQLMPELKFSSPLLEIVTFCLVQLEKQQIKMNRYISLSRMTLLINQAYRRPLGVPVPLCLRLQENTRNSRQQPILITRCPPGLDSASHYGTWTQKETTITANKH